MELEMDKGTPEELKRFRPKTDENAKVRATRFLGLCKSCGECVMKCPVNAISWSKTDLGMLGEPGIVIDLDKCIGCETCERVCPDSAIKIVNKRLSQEKWKKGFLGFIVRNNAWWIERAVTAFRAGPERLKRFGLTPDKTWIARILRLFLRYEKSPITKRYEDHG